MFELSDAVVEEVIFGMENQNCDSWIDLETGSRIERPCEAEEGEDGADSGPEASTMARVRVPQWSSQDGFKLMEDFSRTVYDAVTRGELLAALARGRGVFRAFKNVLDSRPDIEKRWYEHKHKAMRRVIVAWYDDLRELQGLERLGPEPDDLDDLIAEDFVLREGGRSLWVDLQPVFRASLVEALERFPEAVVEYEYTRLEGEIASGPDEGLRVLVAEAVPGDAAGVAVMRTLFVADRSFGKVVYLYVKPERRRLGLGRRLIETARERFAECSVHHVIVDMPFLGDEFGEALGAVGYRSFGARWIKAAED
ncbi:MAG: GNAT family N-acetyltransferase [Spirochaetales bacterium]|nr:GNAT family N-acetyltransferase [Spirochaetales bacterium]